jgi:hypothetical protein
VKPHGVRIVVLPPLNQSGQGAVKESFSVFPDRNLPMQDPFSGVPAGVQCNARFDVLLFEGDARCLHIVGIDNKVGQARLFYDGRSKHGVIHVKPSLCMGVSRAFCAGLNRDDFKIGQRVCGRGNFEEAVVRSKLDVFSTGCRCDAQRRFAPLHSLFQGVGNDNDVV